MILVFPKPLTFLWDKGNTEKNWLKHRVSNTECEEVFYDPSKRIAKDLVHSEMERRYIVFGKTKRNRLLFVVGTIRENMMRIISARDVNSRERRFYEKKS